MSWLGEWWRRLIFFLRRAHFHRELEEEISEHLRMKAEDFRKDGMPPEEARHAARREFGNALLLREQCRDPWGFRWLEWLLQDLRFGIRQLRRNPGFTAVAILTLALGIGANTAIFSVVDAVLLKPLPYPGADRMVFLYESLKGAAFLPASWPDFVDWQAQNRVFQGMAALQPGQFTVSGKGAPDVISAAAVSNSFFRMFGVQPVLGRSFTESECKPGSALAVIVSHSFWQEFLGADPSAVGTSVTLDGQAATVVGVLPSRFRFPNSSFDVYWPLGQQSNIPGMLSRANHPGLEVIAKLRPAISLRRAQLDMDTIMARLGREYPKSDRNEKADLVPMTEQLVGGVRNELLLLLGAVGLLLLLGCANIANMTLARAAARQHEFAVRVALGASGGRMARHLLVESLFLGLLGGAAGLLLAGLTIAPLVRLYPHHVFRLGNAHLDARVFLFTFAISILAGVLFGLAPTLTAQRTNPNKWLKDGGPSGGSRNSRSFRSGLVMAEIAIAMVLSVGAGLLLRSLRAVREVNPGFRPDHLLALDVTRTGTAAAPSQTVPFYTAALNRIRHLPGVVSASAVMRAPLRGVLWTSPYVPSSHPVPLSTQQPWTVLNMVMPDYFQTIRARLIDSRFFTDSDRTDSLPVAVINQTMAQRLAPYRNPIGRRIYVPYAEHPLLEIVGVIADMKQWSLTRPDMPAVFVPYAQMPVPFMTLVVRTRVNPASLIHPVIAAILTLDKEQPVTNATPMTSVMASATADWRFIAFLLASFALLGLVLAAVGVFGVTAYSVAQRSHEFGIRTALGAQKHDILRLVVGQGVVLAFTGVGIGIAGALALTRFLSTLLYAVKPTDPPTFVAVSLGLTGVALLACYVPARRATKVDPMVALRHE